MLTSFSKGWRSNEQGSADGHHSKVLEGTVSTSGHNSSALTFWSPVLGQQRSPISCKKEKVPSCIKVVNKIICGSYTKIWCWWFIFIGRKEHPITTKGSTPHHYLLAYFILTRAGQMKSRLVSHIVSQLLQYAEPDLNVFDPLLFTTQAFRA